MHWITYIVVFLIILYLVKVITSLAESKGNDKGLKNNLLDACCFRKE